MQQAAAFLSYTRLDNEYFAGNITSLRRLLELGVRVVTGDQRFEIFQDVDGVELGQNWRKSLGDAISSSKFLIPILTPCFLGSEACRDELNGFLHHEKRLARDDLILPIYFVTIPSLEKLDMRKADPLALELSKRQRYDWRDFSELPVTDPNVRKAVRDLSEKIAQALQRTSELEVQMRQEAISARLRNPELDRRFVDASQQIAGEESITAHRRAAILWVDDRPDNNFYEREALGRYSIDFELPRSTDEALSILSANKNFDAIISDMGRPPDPQAGYTLLEAIRARGHNIPFFIYAGSRSPEHIAEGKRRGAQGTTNMPSELIQMVLDSVGLLDPSKSKH